VLRVGILVALAGAGCDGFLGFVHIDKPPPDAYVPTGGWAQIATTTDHTCGIRSDLTLWCWGRNDFGQLGGGVALEVDTPAQVGTSHYIYVAVSDGYTCAINTGNGLTCWGENSYGQLGTGKTDPVNGPSDLTHGWSSVATGPTSVCAIDTNDKVWCWGAAIAGALGNGDASPTIYPPVQVASTSSMHSLTVGIRYACALDSDGAPWCWGDNFNLVQLDNSVGMTVSPTMLPTSERFTRLHAAEWTVCGLRMDGALRCWGDNSFGQLGNGNTSNVTAPAAVGNDAITDWTDFAVGTHHGCALRSTGEAYCWGSNRHSQLATAQTNPFESTPIKVSDGPWMTVFAGNDQTCFGDLQRNTSCAGRTGFGQLGTTGSHATPTRESTQAQWTAIDAGTESTCAIDSANSLYCWGNNANGNVGDGSGLDRQTPTLVPLQPGAGGWSHVAVGDDACAIDDLGYLYCWGDDNDAEVGNGSIASIKTPYDVSQGTQFSTVATTKHTCTMEASTIYCWGRNYDHEIDSSANTPELSKVTIGSSYIDVAAGVAHTCALQSGGAAWCWGFNNVGCLGTNDTNGRSSPTQVTANGQPAFDRILAGKYTSCGLVNATGEAWCWGNNAEGELGDMTTVDQQAPTHLPGAWKELGLGGFFTCGIHTDGTLWCSGSNNYGQLGQGTITVPSSKFLQVGTAADWQHIGAGEFHVCAIKSDGSLWCWGRNDDGELGDATAWTSTLTPLP